MANDPYWNSVVLALRMDDVGLTDAKGHVVSLANVSRSSTQSKFGGYSAYFTGTASGMSIADEGEFNLLNKDFTIDCWVYATNVGSRFTSRMDSTVGGREFAFGISTGGYLFVQTSADGTSTTTTVTAATLFPLNEWHHVAVCRTGTTLKIYLDGVLHATGDSAASLYASTGLFRIGAQSSGGTLQYMLAGYIDDFRVTLGVQRWTDEFDLPTEAIPLSPPKLSGTVVDSASLPVARVVRSHRRSDGMIGGATTSSASDGSFSLDAYDGSAHYVVCLDDNLDENALILDNITPV